MMPKGLKLGFKPELWHFLWCTNYLELLLKSLLELFSLHAAGDLELFKNPGFAAAAGLPCMFSN